MESFEELGVTPELVEALAAEGIEVPTAFQESAIPVLLRGNALLAQAGPGGGTLLAYGLPILQTVDPEANSPRAIVLAPSPERAYGLAEALSRLAMVTGHRVAALGSPWALPELSSVLFATPADFLGEVRSSRVAVEEIQAVVVDGFNGLTSGNAEALESLFEIFPREGLRVLLSLPFTEAAEAFGKAHFHRPVHLPPKAAESGTADQVPQRGEVRYRITGEAKEAGVLQTVSGLFGAGAAHLLLFCLTEDQAADLGDFLALHGFVAGPPGDTESPVWLATADVDGRRAMDDWDGAGPVVPVSVDVPSTVDALDRRHGGGDAGMILVRARELPHLKDTARRVGYKLVPAPEPLPTRVSGELERLTSLIARTLKEEDLAPYFLALEPLFETYAPGEVAAATLALLRAKQATGKAAATEGPQPRDEPRQGGPPPKTWVRLFVGVGEKEGIGPGDLLGAIAGEAGVEGSQVGKIEIRETFSLVEVVSEVAEKVMRGLNGTSIRGRSVRADFDRGGPGGRSPRRHRGGGNPRTS